MKLPTIILCTAFWVSMATGQEDPFLRKGGTAGGASQENPRPTLSATYEVFSLDFAQGAQLQRRNPGDGELYKELVERMGKGEAKQEAIAIIRGLSGQRWKDDAISEFIYPTEFEPGVAAKKPVDPAQKDPLPPGQPPVAAPILPTAFETRNCGTSLEMEPTLSRDQRRVYSVIVPDHVSLVERQKWGQGLSEAEMPLFETQRMNTAFNADVGSPCFIGTLNPFHDPKQEENSARRVWFAFVTFDLVEK